MDLGYSPEKMEPTTLPSAPEVPDCIYPSFDLNHEAAKEFRKAHGNLEVGDELTVTMKLKLSAISESDGRYDSGTRVSFDCLSMNVKSKSKPEGESGGGPADDDEDDGDEPNPAMRKLIAQQDKS